ncbi:hypothetical protein RHAL1_00262 [Beijerinckiaceae bacterium RH AL1]|nr:DUF930 domain-containing protein [Beijerinckiaceae bacterium]VVB42567.1 hypothetical protein RHAL8_00252 [Beijerinckiaceae bacterium RH AL8]VVB42570.1 hypothetical protein RHCH11_RHCH11_00253 [Beijerinckiaceae bacterium RH CH11]VVC53381.1 hypothetical protein RHAL1_00262 [Beijerinckiaceae bacterium RH AL1]
MPTIKHVFSFFATLALAPVYLSPSAAAAGDTYEHEKQVLMRIEPDTRLEQVCDWEAMKRISRATGFRPDRAKSNITVPPTHYGTAMTATGGAFCSKGKWYALSFKCVGNGDRTKVLSLSFQIGAEIPKRRWDDLALWP